MLTLALILCENRPEFICDLMATSRNVSRGRLQVKDGRTCAPVGVITIDRRTIYLFSDGLARCETVSCVRYLAT